MKTRYNYSAAQIIADWRKFKGQQGYAVALAKKHGVPSKVIHNVVYQHRKRKRKADLAYRQKAGKFLVTAPVSAKTRQTPVQSVKVPYNANLGLQNSVVYAGAAFNYGHTIIV